MRRLLILAALCGLLVLAPPALASDKTSMDTRTRTFVSLVRFCNQGVGLAVKVARTPGADLITASRVINDAKGICTDALAKMTGFDTLHFGAQATGCEVTVDFFARSLGRFSDYIDNAKPSDAAAGQDYMAQGHAGYTVCLRGINTRRAVYHLRPL